VDTLVVEDVRCAVAVRDQVEVVAAFGVAPARALVKPGTSFQVAVEGGVGSLVFTLARSDAGSTLEASGRYTAGTGEGLDVVRVRDSQTGEEAVLQYEVRTDARLRGDPELLALPAGSSVPLTKAGGSDRVRWTKVSGPGAVEAGRFYAAPEERGPAVLEVVDDFTGEKARVSVRVLDELVRDSVAHGRLSDVASIVTADFDGDTVPDVAVGRRESDLTRPQGGVVLIFKGSAAGLPAQPTWLLTGESDTAQFGDVLAAGDLDKDGRAELLVSAPGADVTVGDSGALYLYRFGANGPERLRQPLAGLGRGSFGAGMAVEDMDGDGDLDLVVGSPLGDLAPTQTVSQRGVVDIFLLTAGQPVPELPAIRLGGSDLGKTGALEARKGTDLGRGVVAADLNGDGRVDLAALSKVSRFNSDGTSAGVVQPAVSVFFARAEGARFRAAPDVYVLPMNGADSNEGTWRLGAIPAEGTRPPLLVVLPDKADSPDLRTSGGQNVLQDAGAAHLFDVSAFTPQGEPAAQPAQVLRAEAWASLYGDERGVTAGRSWAVADVDGKLGAELLLGAPYATVPQGTTSLRYGGKVLVYPLSELSRGKVLNRASGFLGGVAAADAFGSGVAPWPLPGGGGLVAFAGRASTEGRAFTGRVDAFVKAGDTLAQWTRTSAWMPARPGAERFGESVAIAHGATGLVPLVGAPGWGGPGTNADGNDLNVGRAYAFPVSGSQGTAVAEGASSPMWRGRGVGTDVAFTDFNGDGRVDMVLGAPTLVQPGTSKRSTEVTPVYAQERTGCIPSGDQSTGGVLVSLGQASGGFTAAYRLWAPLDVAGCSGTGCQRKNLGRGVVGGFDLNGDGQQDVGALRDNGFDVWLGRAPDDATLAKLTLGCDPVYSRSFSQPTSAPVALGDLNGDGCDEVSWRYADGSRSGVVVLFGYDAGGARCGGKTQPTTVRLAADGEVFMPFFGLGVATARAGKVLGAQGADFLAVSASGVPVNGVTQPAVLLFESAALVEKRPVSGETVVSADELGMRVLVHRSRAPGFGTSLAGGVDLTGDGAPELVVGAPGASVASDGGGAVFLYAGGPGLTGTLSPMLTVVGDVSERSSLGQDLALVPGRGASPPTLVMGAPLSYRTGTQNGTAFTVPLGF
jgi:hypothetical protein